MNEFNKDPFFLTKYSLKESLGYLFVLLGIMSIVGFESLLDEKLLYFAISFLVITFQHFLMTVFGTVLFSAVAAKYGLLSFQLVDVAVILGAIFFGLKSATWMHNAAHGSFPGKKWFSLFMGEFCATQQSLGFWEWKLSHLYHHKYPDDPVLDPHPTNGKSFLVYLIRMKFDIGLWLEDRIKDQFGAEQASKSFKSLVLAMALAGVLRMFIWFFILGPKYFLLFLLVSKIVTEFYYVHFNYYTHVEQPSGEVEIVDLDNKWYWVLNNLVAGSYMHKTHHKRPYLYDPRSKPLNASESPKITNAEVKA